MNLLLKVPLWIWAVILVGSISILLLLVILLSSRSQVPPNLGNNSTSVASAAASSHASSQISPGDIEQTLKYDYVGIKSNDTIAMFGGDSETTINLDHMNWKSIHWSPDRKLIAVLGLTTSKIYDLFVYQISSGTWRKVTNFAAAATGVTSYVWTAGDKLAFSQGVSPDNWLHTYDYANGQLLKSFRIEGVIKFYQVTAARFVIEVPGGTLAATNNTYQVIDTKGVKSFEFTGTKLGRNFAILNLWQARIENEYLLQARDQDDANALPVIYKWDFNNPAFIQVTFAAGENVLSDKITPMCGYDKDSMFLLGVTEDLRLEFILSNMTTGETAQVVTLPVTAGTNPDFKYICEGSRDLIALKTDTGFKWFEITNLNPIDVSQASSYVELVGKPKI